MRPQAEVEDGSLHIGMHTCSLSLSVCLSVRANWVAYIVGMAEAGVRFSKASLLTSNWGALLRVKAIP